MIKFLFRKWWNNYSLNCDNYKISKLRLLIVAEKYKGTKGHLSLQLFSIYSLWSVLSHNWSWLRITCYKKAKMKFKGCIQKLLYPHLANIFRFNSYPSCEPIISAPCTFFLRRSNQSESESHSNMSSSHS